MAENDILVDGSLNFSGGVDSVKVTTVASASNPRGLRQDQLAWLVNGSIRDGGISTRWGWQPVGQISDGVALYQGGWMYDWTGQMPYLFLSFGGHDYQVVIDPAFSVSPVPPPAGPYTPTKPQFDPPTVPRAFFTQIYQFLVKQPGDYKTLPKFWDGTTIRRSIGITNTSPTAGTPGINEIPAAGPMTAYMSRLWYAQDSLYSAGDIAKGFSGTAPYAFYDAVLNVTENPLCAGGDGFAVERGNIRALHPSANLNAAFGQGQLYVFTRDQVNALTVPVTRLDWIGANNDNMPLQTVAQFDNGTAGERAVVPVNGDLYMMTEEPQIRSLIAAQRYYQQPGNVPISANEQRILQVTNRAYMAWASGIQFDNRLLYTALPYLTPNGQVAFQGVIPLDFVPISSFNEPFNPLWEGSYQAPFGWAILQLFQGNFGGRRRAFAVMVNTSDQTIWLWELVLAMKNENGPDGRVTMQIEFPAFTWRNEKAMKKLIGGELWIDRIYGTVDFTIDYKPDGESCWVPWWRWTECASRSCLEDSPPLCIYPDNAPRGMGYKQTVTLPAPPTRCDQMVRPSNLGKQFQCRITATGYCRVRAIWLLATPFAERVYHDMRQ